MTTRSYPDGRVGQQPVLGEAPLDPPTADIASAFLAEADAVGHRRESRIDRRVVGRLNIINAFVLGSFLTAYVFAWHSAGFMTAQALLIPLFLSGQIIIGLSQSYGAQWRMSRTNWRSSTVSILTGAAVLVSWGIVSFARDQPPVATYFIPGVISVLGFGLLGVIQIHQARDRPRPPTRELDALGRSERWATVAVGGFLSAVVVLLGVPPQWVTSLMGSFLFLAVAAWTCVTAPNWSLWRLGELWRWPQFTAFALGTVTIIAVVLLSALTTLVTPEVATASGVAVMLLFVIAALVGGRNAR